MFSPSKMKSAVKSDHQFDMESVYSACAHNNYTDELLECTAIYTKGNVASIWHDENKLVADENVLFSLDELLKRLLKNFGYKDVSLKYSKPGNSDDYVPIISGKPSARNSCSK